MEITICDICAEYDVDQKCYECGQDICDGCIGGYAHGKSPNITYSDKVSRYPVCEECWDAIEEERKTLIKKTLTETDLLCPHCGVWLGAVTEQSRYTINWCFACGGEYDYIVREISQEPRFFAFRLDEDSIAVASELFEEIPS
jgi:hypothetical protein